ncbi:MAG: hypothetical protein LQ342_003465 [Letrouitia transgressa]|nr:MAG: hypothetical protein LQ342_003465 [Letrouitia transgressa]
MAAEIYSIANPLVTIEQLSTSSSQLDGVPADLEASIRYAGAKLTQAAGIQLRLPQEVIAQAIVIFMRFYVGPEGGSFLINSAKDVSAAAIYITSKISAEPQSARSVLNVYAHLLSIKSSDVPERDSKLGSDLNARFVLEGSYQSERLILLQTEAKILRCLGFETKVIIPHHLALTYLQTLGTLAVPPIGQSTALARRTIGYLNTALFSSQLLYLTHQPSSLAVAAVYLAAREVGVKLPGNEWWEVFDVDREELGFLVVGLRSCEGFIESEKEKWAEHRCPLTVEDLEETLSRLDTNVAER